ncbi:hypothetical protein KR044_003446 [Drosophila immigrans]|nr:hypothetical protein KR044_003446 [Drosophila immigrans]
MVKVNSGTKMMVNRAIELLNAKIARAQSRHVAKRMPVVCHHSCNMDLNVMKREMRQKCQEYDASKRLSMWEQNKDQANGPQNTARLDQSHYKQSGLKKRSYDCTWVDFPERPPTKPQPIFILEEHIPLKRRKSENRPETAKPCDPEATDFMKQIHSSVSCQKTRMTLSNSSPKAMQGEFIENSLAPRYTRFCH